MLKNRAQVILDQPLPVLDYEIPEKLNEGLEVGQAVKVPLGNRQTLGYVTQINHNPKPVDFKLKEITKLEENRRSLPSPLLKLVIFAADYYQIPHGEMLNAILPQTARTPSYKYILTDLPVENAPGRITDKDALILELGEKYPNGFTVISAEQQLKSKRTPALQRLKRLEQKGLLERITKKAGPRKLKAYQRIISDLALKELPPTEQEILEQFSTDSPITVAAILPQLPNAYPKLRKLEAKGYLQSHLLTQSIRPPDWARLTQKEPLELTSNQQQALSMIENLLKGALFTPCLLHGVTGSGKTEVYLRLIEKCLFQSKTALVLVPEIALTPQLTALFQQRFGDQVATFHSGLTPAQRRDEWDRIWRGDASIGVGARSALFLPIRNLDLIVVDEEHETSYKQDETPHYHARDLAIYRAKLEGAQIVLGSATPSLESYQNSQKKRYHYQPMGQRVHSRPLPPVELLSLREEPRVGSGIFTNTMLTQIETTLQNDNQVILFLNRRGYASCVTCQECGFCFQCPACEVSLTLHRQKGLLLCHYCAFEQMVLDKCPDCQSESLRGSGMGTEKIEMEIRSFLGPNLGIVRLDRDTTQSRNKLRETIETFRSGEAQVLIGTQMVTKGHDFHNVTLVGVIAADASLNFPDFRAAERTFQLLTQVAGRAGRGSQEGKVLFQTYDPEHYAIRYAAEHDYEKFVKEELTFRKELGYPPFGYLALIRVESPDQNMAMAEANAVAETLGKAWLSIEDVEILGPAPAPLARLREAWRFQILLKAKTRRALQSILRALPNRQQTGAKRIVDIDPISML